MVIADKISTQELPYWMKQARRGVDWGVLLAMAFSIIVAWPVILQPGLPRTNASENYVFRTDDYAAAIREGYLYPRWSPHVFSGYGAPIPNYYPPGAAYVSALVQVFLTDDPVLAVRMIYAAALCLAGVMTYVYVTRRAGARAGLLASIIYIYSPYVGLVAPHILGDLSGVIALCLLPSLLWAVDRLLILNRPFDVAWVSLIAAGLMFTDPRIALVGFLLAIFILIWHLLTTDSTVPWFLAVLACLIGICIAAPYWFSALLEYDAVRWRAPQGYSYHPVMLGELLSIMRQVDLAELKPTPQFTIGQVALFVSSLGVFGLAITRKFQAFQIIFLIAAIVLVVGLVVFSTQVWLFGPLMLCLSVVSTASLSIRSRIPERWQRLFLPGLLIFVLIGSLPVWLAFPWSDSFGDTSPTAQIDYEQQGYGIAVLPPDVGIPLTISETLPPNRYLISGYQTDNVNKIGPGQITASALANLLAHNTHSDLFQLRIIDPVRFDILTAYFPGWRATVDGVPVNLSRDDETGLMRVSLPRTLNSELWIGLEATPVRTAGWVIFWGMVAIDMILIWGRLRNRRPLEDDLDLLVITEARLLGVLLVVFVFIILLFATPFSPLPVYVRPGYALDNKLSVRSRTNVGLEVLALEINRTSFRPGEDLDFRLFWRVLRRSRENYQVRVFLLPIGEQTRLDETDYRHPGNYPTSRWITDRYVTDPYHLSLPVTMPFGEYQIGVEAVVCNPVCVSQNHLTFFDPSGNSLGQNLILPMKITVE